MLALPDIVRDLALDKNVNAKLIGEIVKAIVSEIPSENPFVRAIVADAKRMQEARSSIAEKNRENVRKRWGKKCGGNTSSCGGNTTVYDGNTTVIPPSDRTENHPSKQTEAESRACAREEVSDSASETSASVEISHDLSESSASASAKILQSIMKPDTKGKEQFVRTLRNVCAKKNEDALVGLATAFCGDASTLLADRAYRKRLKEVGFGNFANELEMFAADCFAGEEPKNRGAAFSARLKKLAEDLGR